MADTVLDAKQKAAPKDGIDIDWLRQSQPMTNGDTTAKVGASLSIGGVSGIVKRMTMLPNGVVRVTIEATQQGGADGTILLWPTGMEGRVCK
jgi:hypothetical protein